MRQREFTRHERKTIRRLITEMCANYDREYGCLPLNGICECHMFTVDSPDRGFCKYFRNTVLPLNPSLEAVFAGIYATKSCKICNAEFAPVGRQAYCSEKCRHAGNRKTTTERVRKHRQKTQ